MRYRLDLFLVLAVTAMAYLPSLSHPFQYDDLNYILRNRQLADPLGFFGAFAEEGYSNWTTRLVPNLILSWNYFVFGFNPLGYHATNLAIHLVNVALLWRFSRAVLERLGNQDRFISLTAAALFALHPLNTEAVVYCNARPNTVCTAFYLMTMLALMAAVESHASNPRRRIGLWSLFGMLLVFTLLTKELAVTIVVTGPLLLLWLGSGPWAHYRAIQSRVVWLLVGLFLLGMLTIATTGAWSYVTVTSVYTFGWDLGSYLFLNTIGQAAVFFRYLGLALAPLPTFLNVDHDVRSLYQLLSAQKGLWSDGQWEMTLWPMVALLGVLALAAGAIGLRKRSPFVSYFMLWPLLTHAPTSLIPRGEQMVEYRTYLPMIGICLLFAWAAAKFVGKLAENFTQIQPGTMQKVGIGAVMGLFAFGVLARAAVWKTQESLWLDTIKKSPRKARPYLNLGHVQETAGDLTAAIDSYSKGLAAVPRNSKLYYNRGNARAAQSDQRSAIEDFTRSLEIEPDFADAHNNRGQARLALGEIDAAIDDYTRALVVDSKHAWAYSNRAAARGMKRDFQGALADCDAAIQANPHLAGAYLNRGNLRAAKGDQAGALRDYRDALGLSPGLADVYFNRSLIRARQGDLSGAASDLDEALRVAPANWPHRDHANALRHQVRAAIPGGQ